MHPVWRNVLGNIVVGGLRISQNSFYLKSLFKSNQGSHFWPWFYLTYTFKGIRLLRSSNEKRTVFADFDSLLFVSSYYKVTCVHESLSWAKLIAFHIFIICLSPIYLFQMIMLELRTVLFKKFYSNAIN